MSFDAILIYHPESDCYCIGTEADLISNGVVETYDVTGQLDHMAEAKRRGIELPMNKTEQAKERTRGVTQLQDRLVLSGSWQCCLNCSNYCNGTPAATQMAGAPDGWQGCIPAREMPPPGVLVVGCENHIPDLPF